jgi:hypothetical protein
MPDFGTWLHQQPAGQSADLDALRTFAETTPRWPFWSNDLAEHRAFINQLAPPPQNIDDLRAALARYFGQWEAEERLSRTRTILGWLAENGGGVALVAFGAFVLLAVSIGLYSGQFFASLAKVEQTRGLITFLFAFSTTGVILLIAVAIFWARKDEDIKARFGYAKDLLTIVIGILGTIMGFYFGLQTDTGSIVIANPTLSQTIAKTGDEVTVTAQILGGKAPYSIAIEFVDPIGALKERIEVKPSTIEAGIISHKVKIPEVVKPGGVLFTITAKDAKGAQVQSAGTLFVQPVQPGPTVPGAAPGGAGPTTPTPPAPGAAPTTPAPTTTPSDATRTPAPATTPQ